MAASYGLGLRPVLHFASVDPHLGDHPDVAELRAMAQRLPALRDEDGTVRPDFSVFSDAERARYDELRGTYLRLDVLTRAAGPPMNLLAGLLGLLAVRLGRRAPDGLTSWGWAGATVAAIAFRPVLGLATAVVTGSTRGDEAQIALALGWWRHALLLPEAVFAGALLLLLFAWLPAAERWGWAAGTAAGGVTGMRVWHHLLGPLLLP